MAGHPTGTPLCLRTLGSVEFLSPGADLDAILPSPESTLVHEESGTARGALSGSIFIGNLVNMCQPLAHIGPADCEHFVERQINYLVVFELL